MVSFEEYKSLLGEAGIKLIGYTNFTLVLEHYEINTRLRLAHFIAQLKHESCNFTKLTESLKYSEKRLLEIFPKYFTKETAKEYAGKPKKIANKVYSNRLGNGDESSNDGWTYRGRGVIQITGKSNYRYYGKLLELDLVEVPELACEPVYTFMIAGAFWLSKGCNQLADKDDIKAVTRKINGGYNGLEDRKKCLNICKSILKC